MIRPVLAVAVAAALGIVLLQWTKLPLAPLEAPEPEALQETPLPLPDLVEAPIERIDRLMASGGGTACVLGGAAFACSRDGGRSWPVEGSVPSPPLAVVAAADGAFLVATLDGSIYRRGAEDAPDDDAEEPWVRLPEEIVVSDAAVRDGALVLLAHRYDAPADFMRLPRVVETRLISLREDGAFQTLASAKGFGGDRLLLQARGGALTFASADRRAWASQAGGSAFRRLPDQRRFGADFGGLIATVERRPEPLPGPGRPARPASSLWLSWDGGESWTLAFETPGELLVDFADRRTGLLIARGEGLAWRSGDGGRSFAELRHDDRFDQAADIAWVDGHFLVATRDGRILFVDPDGP